MIFRVLLFIFTIFFIPITWAQKPKVDTVYVYEKVIVYDTVYVEKTNKIQPSDPIKNLPAVPELPPEKSDLKIKDKDSLNKKTSPSRFRYGVEAGIGFKNSNWSTELVNHKAQFGQNFGLWISRSILNPNLSVMFAANVYRWNSTFDLDANKEDTYLNGFYFTKDSQPLLFQRFNNKHMEYTAQLKVLYEWNKIRPSVGFLVNRNVYKMQFLVPENNVLNKLDDFKSKQFNFGFSLGIQYQILRKVSINVDYQYYKMKHFSLKNNSFDFDIFKTSNTFAERKLNLGISYAISK